MCCFYRNIKERYYNRLEQREVAEEEGMSQIVGRYTIICDQLTVYDGPSKYSPRRGQRNRGDELLVVAAKDDWLALAEGEGWVKGYSAAQGHRVQRVDSMAHRPSLQAHIDGVSGPPIIRQLLHCIFAVVA